MCGSYCCWNGVEWSGVESDFFAVGYIDVRAYAPVLWAAMDAKLSMHPLGNRLGARETALRSWKPAHMVCHFVTVDAHMLLVFFIFFWMLSVPHSFVPGGGNGTKKTNPHAGSFSIECNLRGCSVALLW